MQRSLFTPNEWKLFELTSDGLRHIMEEIRLLLGDEFSSNQIVYNCVNQINKKLEPNGQRIICEVAQGRNYYRRVMLLSRNNGE